MSKLGINTGFVANDGTGDTLRTGAIKINSNFDEVYNALGDGSNILVGFGKTVISIGTTSYNVGIGSTIPREKLDITGNLYVSGIITASKLSANLEGNIYSTGIVTSSGYYIGTDQVIDSNRELKNILSLDSITKTTIENSIKLDPNDFDSLNVSGITTLGTGVGSTALFVNGSLLVGNTSRFLKDATFVENLEVQNNSNIIGVITATTFNGQINAGVSTLGITTFTDTVSFGSSVYFGDSDKLYFGDGQDLEIYHNTTNSIIENKTGNLYLKTTNGSINLEHNGSNKLETTGYGVTVFGILNQQGFYSSGISTIYVNGVGNALVVQDNTNPSVTPFVVGTAGSVGIKTSLANYPLQVGSVYTKSINARIYGAFRSDKVIGIHTMTVPIGNYGGFSPTIDSFGIPTDLIFDCLYEPAGQVYPVDYGSLS